jgi:NTE family protein
MAAAYAPGASARAPDRETGSPRRRRHDAPVRLNRRPDVLVLGGGGLLGEAWLRSCLAGIEAEAGWDLRECDASVGTSAGSIVAAVLAAGRRPEAAGGVAEGWAHAADSRRPAPDGTSAAAGRPTARGGLAMLAGAARGAALRAAAPVAPPLSAALEPGGAALRAAALRRGRPATREIPGLREALERMGAEFDGRLRVTAIDLASGRRVVFGAPGAPPASVTEAVLASCAVPWVFRPRTIGGREYVDGGFGSAANVDAAPVRRGDEVLCLVPTASTRLALDRFGALRAFAGTTVAAESLLLRRRGARVRVVAPDAPTVTAIGPSLFDRERRPQVEAAGYAQGRALASAP